jgi:hypothetical protein
LSEEIKTFLHVGNDRLRGRKFQPSFLQKLLDEGFNFSSSSSLVLPVMIKSSA